MTFSNLKSQYWRIPVVAILAALLAFGISFAVKPTYTSTARLLIVEGSTTLLNGQGQQLGSQPGSNIVTGSLAQALAETDGGLASSREVATMVVDKLHLTQPKHASHGIIHALEGALATTYAHIRAWITAGFYRNQAPREKAIQNTEKAITGADLAPNGGPDTGQADSFILALSCKGTTSLNAQEICNAAANALVTVNRERFESESRSYAAALGKQLNQANASLASANQAVSQYEVANNISSVDQQTVENVQNAGSLAAQIRTEQATVEGDRQTVASLQASLGGTPTTTSTNQNITTGRSTTADNTTQANPVYQTMEEQLGQAQATLASDSAKLSSLQSQQGTGSSAQLTRAEAHLLDLEQTVTADQNTVQSLSSALQQANANVAVSPVSLSRLGRADLPNYPSSPKRYLFLILGLILGALAGAGLTYLARSRRQPDGDGTGSLQPSVRTVSDDTVEMPLVPSILVGARSSADADGDVADRLSSEAGTGNGIGIAAPIGSAGVSADSGEDAKSDDGLP